MKFLEEVDEQDITNLFIYEDFLKESIFKNQRGMMSLKSLQNRMKKIYVDPTAN